MSPTTTRRSAKRGGRRGAIPRPYSRRQIHPVWSSCPLKHGRRASNMGISGRKVGLLAPRTSGHVRLENIKGGHCMRSLSALGAPSATVQHVSIPCEPPPSPSLTDLVSRARHRTHAQSAATVWLGGCTTSAGIGRRLLEPKFAFLSRFGPGREGLSPPLPHASRGTFSPGTIPPLPPPTSPCQRSPWQGCWPRRSSSPWACSSL